MRQWIALAGFLVLTACGSDSPTSVTPDPPTPPPLADADWQKLDNVFGDPFYMRLPRLLADQAAAQPLNDAVTAMVAAIAAQNLEAARQQLVAIGLHRTAYQSRPAFEAKDRPLLQAMALLEMRGKVLVPAVALNEITILPEGGNP